MVFLQAPDAAAVRVRATLWETALQSGLLAHLWHCKDSVIEGAGLERGGVVLVVDQNAPAAEATLPLLDWLVVHGGEIPEILHLSKAGNATSQVSDHRHRVR